MLAAFQFKDVQPPYVFRLGHWTEYGGIMFIDKIIKVTKQDIGFVENILEYHPLMPLRAYHNKMFQLDFYKKGTCYILKSIYLGTGIYKMNIYNGLH